ncbi:MAG: site-specific DNA-methyltransferase [Bacteroidetes bacterium]|nr:MAG: site-specific DNA-methyltransferase [Bacteroidota bacterium]
MEKKMIKKLKRKKTIKFNKIYQGDVKTTLKKFPSNIVDCVVTSPPYWNLRDYGTGEWVGSKDPKCKHIKNQAFSSKTTIQKNQKKVNKGRELYYNHKCPKCGAVKKDLQIGAEKTPEEYVETMVKLFRQIKRMLKDTGTVWLNLGDTYIGGGRGSGGKSKVQTGNKGSLITTRSVVKNLPSKNLVGIPWRVALALQADGWILRQEIIWNKPACMPESVTDRCTKSHEHIFLLTKNPNYYFDHKIIQEPSVDPASYKPCRPRNETAFDKSDPKRRLHSLDKNGNISFNGKIFETRNKRTVWNVSITNYKGAHFATFPPKLIEPCILAGCPKGGVVFDPFFGSGTSGSVAKKNNRKYLGVELNPKYIKLAKQRLKGTLPNLF